MDKMFKSLFIDIALKDCINAINEDKKYAITESSAGYILSKNNEEFQVQIKVVRKKDEFLDDLVVQKTVSMDFKEFKNQKNDNN